MSDVTANINVGLDPTQALAGLRTLQSQISTFNKSIVTSNATAMAAQKDMVGTMVAQIGASKAFTTSFRDIETSTTRLGKAIDKNKLSMGEYFRYGVASSKTFGKVFRSEHDQMMKLAEHRVKSLQTQYVALGETQSGVTRAMAARPTQLMGAGNAISIQRQQLFNKLLHDGSTSLINFGKNTQWAGRQLMVGFTVPLTIFGATAGKIFMDLEKQMVQFRRVYGDLNTPMSETNGMLEQVKALGKEYTKYGIAVKDTIALAATAAATGAQGKDLIAVTAEATRLSTLGQIDQNQALTATIALQTAFKISSADLASTTDFLNAVENQTVTTLGDLTEAIPRVAPVIRGLGGDVKDMAVFLTAMREGGVSAAEGANALKSGLASLINPTKAAREQLAAVGINIDEILSKNKGDIQGMVRSFGDALSGLDKFSRQQTLAKVFGKYQFARLGALFSNISKEGSQAQRVIDLTAMSVKDLASISDKELGSIEQATGVRFTAAIEKVKLAIAPIGEIFLKVATPIIEKVGEILDKFNELSPGVKTFITVLVAGLGVVVPTVIMLVGLFANFAGNAIKGISLMNGLFNRLKGGGGVFNYLAESELEAAAAAASLEGKTTMLTSSLNVQREAVQNLSLAYGNYVASAGAAAASLPQGFRVPGRAGPAPRRMATGGIVPGSGSGDKIPALLEPGETVVTKSASKKFGSVLGAMNAGSLPGFANGRVQVGVPGSFVSAHFSAPRALTASEISGVSSGGRESTKAAMAALQQAEMAIVGYSNEVVQTSYALNDSLNKGGASVEAVRKDLVTNAPFAHNELALQMKGLGATEEQIQASIARITREIEMSLNAMGKDVVVTEEKFGQIVSNAYKKVAAAGDQAVAQAHQQMGQITTLANPLGRAKGERISIGGKIATSYRDKRQQFVKRMQGQSSPVPYGTAGGFDIAPMAAAMGQDAKQISRVWNSLDDGIKMRLASMRGNIEKFNAELILEAKKVGITIGTAGIEGIAESIQSASPSKRARKEGVNLSTGFAQGVESGVPAAMAAGEELEQAALAGASGGRIPGQGRRSTRPQAPAGQSLSEIAAQQAAQRRAERNARGPVTREQGPPTGQVSTAAKAQSPFYMGLPVATVETQKKIIDSANEMTKEQDAYAKELRKQNSPLRKMGAKVQGTMFAMDGLVFGLSMMNNSIGEFAQKIMPAVFAVQGITMMWPLLASPLGIAIAAIAALGFGVWKMNSVMDDTRKAGALLGSAMTATASEVNSVGDFYQNKSLAADNKAKEFSLTEKQLSKAQSFIKTDIGKTITEEFSAAMTNVGKAGATKQFASKLSSMVLQGVINNKQAQAIGSALEEELGVKGLSVNINGELKTLIGPDGVDVLKHPVSVAIEIQQKNMGFADNIKDSMTDALTKAQAAMGDAGSRAKRDMDRFAAVAAAGIPGISDLFHNALNLDPDIQNATKLATAYGTALGNIVQNGYDNLSAATERYTALQKAANAETDPKKKKALLASLKEEEQSLIKLNKMTENSMKRASKGFNDLKDNPLAQQDILAGNKIAVETLFKDSTQKDFVDMVFSKTKDLDRSARFTLEVAMSSGQFSPSIMNAMFNLFKDDKQAAATMDIAINTSGVKGASDLFNEVLLLPDEALQKEISIQASEVSKATMNNITEGLKILNSLPPKITKTINADSFGIDEAERLNHVVETFDGYPKKIKISRIANFFKNNFEKVYFGINWFNGLSDSVQKSFLATYTVHFNETGSLTAAGKAALFKAYPDMQNNWGQLPGGYNGPAAANLVNDNDVAQANKDQAAVTSSTSSSSGSSTPTGGGGSNSGGGGGDKTDTPFQTMKKALLERIRLYNDMTMTLKTLANAKSKFADLISGAIGFQGGLAQKLRAAGFNEQAVADILSKGFKEGNQIYNKLTQTVGKNGARRITTQGLRLERLQQRTTIGEAYSNNIAERNNGRVQTLAFAKLTAAGIDKETAATIAGDAALAQAVQGLKKGSVAWKQYIASVQQGRDAQVAFTRSMDPLQTALDDLTVAHNLESAKTNVTMVKFTQAQNALDRGAREGLKASNDKIKALQSQVDLVQEEIDAQEKLNSTDQTRIRDLERQKEMLNRQINDLERANEIDQRRIDIIQRESDIRGRVADALSHELNIMSQQEEKIRTAYQARIDALQEVVDLNAHIAEQQRGQLSLADALSSGDIGAAAGAMVDINASNSAYAADQAQKGLQAGMDNAVNSLTTQNGMTRAQAEAQIQTIQEQQYQTGLLIQSIQDQMYQRTLAEIPLKDAQRAIDDQILVIQDAIYARETVIMGIQTARLVPLQAELDLANKALTQQEADLENAKAALRFDGLSYEQLQDLIQAQTDLFDAASSQIGLNKAIADSVQNIKDKWASVADQIAEANRVAAERSSQARGVNNAAQMAIDALVQLKKMTPKQAAAAKAAANASMVASIVSIEAARAGAVEAARASMGLFAGGLAHFASGSIVGAGARDSVPAVLTPGEFVVRRSMVDKYGMNMLSSINQGSFSMPKFAVPKSQPTRIHRDDRRSTAAAPVYNTTSVTVTVPQAGATADQVANVVMNKLDQVNRQNVRSISGNR